jgi:predicted Zn-dependent peptidase
VILEERRLRVDNSPIGQMVEALLDKAYDVNPYKRPVIGYEQDIRNLTREDVQQFFDAHYYPRNLAIAIVGDVNPDQVKQLAQVYFGRYKAKVAADTQIPAEPPQKSGTGRNRTTAFTALVSGSLSPSSTYSSR